MISKFLLFVLLCLASCTNSTKEKNKPYEIVLGDKPNKNDTIEPLGFIYPLTFETSLDTTASFNLVSYKVNDSTPVKKMRVSRVKVFYPRSEVKNKLSFSLNDTFHEGMKYEINMNINGKFQKNIYSDFIFEKNKVYLGWSVTLESYKKNGKVIHHKKDELDW